jgi:general secretion pathway protein L
MAEILVIRFSNQTSSVEWIRVDTNGTRLSEVSSGLLADAAKAVEARQVIVLVPSTDVLTTSIAIPVRSPAKIRATLPFALEETLADDLDTLHFAAGRRDDNGIVSAAVVAHEKMRSWIEQLREAGIEAQKMVAENHGLPLIPGSMSLLIDQHCTMFNDGDRLEFSMQDVKPSDVLAAAGCLSGPNSGDDAKEEHDANHLLAFCSARQDEILLHDWNALRHELASVDVNLLPDGVLPKLAVTVASGAGVNMLQGQYGQKTEVQELLRPWKTAAALLLGVLLLGLAGKAADNYRLQEEFDVLQQQFTTQYRQLRPGDSRDIADPLNTARSMKRGFGTTASPQLFLPSIKALGLALSGNADSAVEVISYRAGVIDIRLTAPDVPTLDKIRTAVAESGQFEATIQSTDQVADKINGRIRIREAGS